MNPPKSALATAHMPTEMLSAKRGSLF